MKAESLFYFMKEIRNLRMELQSKNRFFPSKSCAEFVEELVEYGRNSKSHNLTKNIELFRARRHKHEPRMKNVPYSLKDMGAPPASYMVKRGRINPTGIPYLYLANDIRTAVAEVRPWVGCKITVAKFVLCEDVSLISFSNKIPPIKKVCQKTNKDEYFWQFVMAYWFSMPFDPRDDLSYVPIQYICEKVKSEGFDGILYDSALNVSGYNVCLFRVNAAKGKNPFIVSVKSIAYKYEVDVVATR